ncbi:MAG: class I SAM-dependent methyltransferase [Actinobacteria bacterium]|jgi:predicted O-methyltransferase YrrM|nr:class I SAM-dependent methyltransferase [Actinomycetota bacterium]
MKDLIPKTTREKLARLEGLVSEEVGLRLATFAAAVPADQAIVECGSYKGKSGCYLAEGAKRGGGAHVWCVDPWSLAGNATGRYGFAEAATMDAFQVQVARMGHQERITQVQAFAADYGRAWNGPDVGLLFIDSDHRYTPVKADFLAWEPHLVPGAIVVFDDAHHTKECNRGVGMFVEELRSGSEWVRWDIDIVPIAVGWRV